MFRFRMFITLCAILFPVLAMAASTAKKAPAKTSPSDVLPFKATEKTLPNGLKVIIVPTGFPNIVALYVPVQTGSRNEIEPGKSGFAHFFEHVMFKGTPNYPPEKFNAIVTKAGARENANTWDDRTIYHITFAKEDLPQMLEVYADRFMNLTYSEPTFRTEARAVLGEYNKNSANPVRKLLEVQRDAAYKNHTYRHTTMGFIRDIEDMPNQYEYSKEFFRRWYRPEYTTVIVAGDVEPEETFKLVEKYWGIWKRGDYKISIPRDAAPTGPVYAHVPWTSETLPYITVAFRGPGFTNTQDRKDTVALETLYDLEFGATSDFYKRLVEDEQKVDATFVDNDPHVDPYPFTVFARVKKQEDVLYVRDQILRTFAKMRDTLQSADRLEQAKSFARYSLIRSLDNSEAVAETLAEFVKFNRAYGTLNEFYRLQASLTPKDLQSAAKKYITDNNLIVTTLSKDPLPAAIATQPPLSSFAGKPATKPMSSSMQEGGASTGNDLRVISQKSIVPQVQFKLLFNAGSANDPQGKEGLAALAATMIVDAGSKAMKMDAIRKALYPMAGSFSRSVDKDMTALTGSIHKDNWKKFADIVLPQLLSPGFREEDFTRVRDAQLNNLKENLRNNNEEELGKEELANRIYAGTPYGHTVRGTIAGIQSITLDDVKRFIAENYNRGNLVVGISGDYPEAMLTRIKSDLARLPQGSRTAGGIKTLPAIAGQATNGLNIEIIKKETRATGISLGLPLPLTRASGADFAALNIARAWLGEHRMSQGHLFKRLREVRGLNYGNYAYIEYFNNPGGQFFPSANIARRAQFFELWIRPVQPANAHMAMRIALYELNKLIENGMSAEDFENTRQYLTKNVYVATSTQDQQLGYALDSWWYGIPEYTQHMRSLYSQLTRDDVNRVLKKYLSPSNMHVVIVTKDAEALRDQLVADAFSPITYESEKPSDVLDEDKIIGAYKLNIRPENVTIVPVEEVFAR